uniref:WAT1-related protein n=1 Tax=Oryza barthii TaxID=65489 RepID=A0A0D3GR16_9ORYZ
MAPAATGGGGGEDDAAVPLLLPVLPPAAGWCSWEWEDVAISAGLVAVQLAGAAYMVVLAPVLALGLDPLFLVTFGSLATGLFTLPFAINLERKRWPVTVFQALMLHGMKKTSPAIASTMPNLAPAFIFVVAACLGFERVDLSCRYTRAKIAGTVLCLAGAVTMSVLQSPAAAAATRIRMLRVTIDGWIMEAYGGLVSSVCVMFQTWALEKKGPVVVSLFSPTQTVGSAIFSAFMLGMVFLFSGLYVVLWAKKKECQVDRMVEDGTANDIEKPLLFQD